MSSHPSTWPSLSFPSATSAAITSEWCSTLKCPPNCGYSLPSVLKQCGHWVTIFFKPYFFKVSTFCCASAWKRYSFPSRRAESPLQVSSSPRMQKDTPAERRIFTSARETLFCRSSKLPAQPTKKRYSISFNASGESEAATGISRSEHHSSRRLLPIPQG